MGLLCAIIGVGLAHQNVNLFTQIGFDVLVGLAQERDSDRRVRQTTARGRGFPPGGDVGCLAAPAPTDPDDLACLHPECRLTAPCPGAGAEMRRALGQAVFSGMLGITAFGILLTPVFFGVIQRIAEWRNHQSKDQASPLPMAGVETTAAAPKASK